MEEEINARPRYEYAVIHLDSFSGRIVSVDGESASDALGRPGLEDHPYLNVMGWEGWHFVGTLTSDQPTEYATILMERVVRAEAYED